MIYSIPYYSRVKTTTSCENVELLTAGVQTSQRPADGTALPNEQMRLALHQYPIDRYMGESSCKKGPLNIIDDNLWHSEPTLKPEDEMVLRKLNDMLHSTASDLKELSDELVRLREPPSPKHAPTPFDHKFNEKMHLDHVVNAKFQVYEPDTLNIQNKRAPAVHCSANKDYNVIQNNIKTPVMQKDKIKKLSVSRTKVIDIDESKSIRKKQKPIQIKEKDSKKLIFYDECTYHNNVNSELIESKKLKVQVMPKINIRSELKKQVIFNLDIAPDNIDKEIRERVKNSTVFNVEHITADKKAFTQILKTEFHKPDPTRVLKERKVTIMSDCESSEPNNISSSKDKRNSSQKLQLKNFSKSKNKSEQTISQNKKHSTCDLNNKEYLPYSRLTLGGVRLSDLEKEVSDLSDNPDEPLSPVINKIINNKNNKIKNVFNDKLSQRALSVSDENLQQQVMELKASISKTLSENDSGKTSIIFQTNDCGQKSSEGNSPEHYDDDFDESPGSDPSQKQINPVSFLPKTEVMPNISNKVFQLSLKDKVDVSEYIHVVKKLDSGTQIDSTNSIALKHTQTSPRSNSSKTHSNTPHEEINNMFKLEKDFIKNIIIEEYGDLFKNDLMKTNSNNDLYNSATNRNLATLPKNTQTTPSKVKSVMTSPKKSKSIATSPLTSIATKPKIDTLRPNEHPKTNLHLPRTSEDVLTNINTYCLKSNSKKTNIHYMASKILDTTSSYDAYLDTSSEPYSLGEVKQKRSKYKNSNDYSSQSSSSITSDSSTINSTKT